MFCVAQAMQITAFVKGKSYTFTTACAAEIVAGCEGHEAHDQQRGWTRVSSQTTASRRVSK